VCFSVRRRAETSVAVLHRERIILNSKIIHELATVANEFLGACSAPS
jgi:hypothetical protein